QRDHLATPPGTHPAAAGWPGDADSVRAGRNRGGGGESDPATGRSERHGDRGALPTRADSLETVLADLVQLGRSRDPEQERGLTTIVAGVFQHRPNVPGLGGVE